MRTSQLFYPPDEDAELAGEAYANYYGATLSQISNKKERSREPAGHTQYTAPSRKTRHDHNQ